MIELIMNILDRATEKASRRVAQTSSRRSLLKRLSIIMIGGGSIPLLPVARASENNPPHTPSGNLAIPEDPGDPTHCDYWRYCGINGSLCSCCGGKVNACPPGTEMSPITWIGTCQNPADNLNYIISYNDCCGNKTGCERCFCNRNEGDTPMYRPFTNNDINWCFGTSTNIYHCSTAVILGVAID